MLYRFVVESVQCRLLEVGSLNAVTDALLGAAEKIIEHIPSMADDGDRESREDDAAESATEDAPKAVKSAVQGLTETKGDFRFRSRNLIGVVVWNMPWIARYEARLGRHKG